MPESPVIPSSTQVAAGAASEAPPTSYSYVADLSRHGDINDYLSAIIGPRFAEYRALWARAHAMEIETEFPLFLALETLFRCNYKCTMCTYSDPAAVADARYTERMSAELFDRILDEVASHGCPSMNFNVLDEPLLDPDITDRVAKAKAAGVLDLRMNTNGSLLTEEKAAALIDAGLTRLYVGLDAATPETYARVRVGGDLERVERNIERFLEIRAKKGSLLPILRVSFVRLAANEAEIDAYREKWRGRADLVTVQEYMPPVLDDRFLKKHAESRRMADDYTCPQPFERLVVKGNGDVHPCCAQYNYKIEVGNLRDHTIHALWNSETMKRLRQHMRDRTWTELETCKSCLESSYLYRP